MKHGEIKMKLRTMDFMRTHDGRRQFHRQSRLSITRNKQRALARVADHPLAPKARRCDNYKRIAR